MIMGWLKVYFWFFWWYGFGRRKHVLLVIDVSYHIIGMVIQVCWLIEMGGLFWGGGEYVVPHFSDILKGGGEVPSTRLFIGFYYYLEYYTFCKGHLMISTNQSKP